MSAAVDVADAANAANDTEKLHYGANPQVEKGVFAANKYPNTGLGRYYLAGANPENFPKLPATKGKDDPAFAGTVAEFVQQHPTCAAALQNRVKRCPKCDKMNGVTLQNCNLCGNNLLEVEVITTDNVLGAFCLGIQGPADKPHGAYLRLEKEDVMVIDDPLVLGPCHLLAIYTGCWIPDWRFLLRDAERGLQIVDLLDASCRKVTDNHFFGSEEMRPTFWRKMTKEKDSLYKYSTLGFNYPPSQNQLHLQCIPAPLLPYHYDKLMDGEHLHWERFYSLEFVRTVLNALKEKGLSAKNESMLDVKESTSVENLIDWIRGALDIDYMKMHSGLLNKSIQDQQYMETWNVEHFSKLVVQMPGKKIVIDKATGEVDNSVTPDELQKRDMEAIRSYAASGTAKFYTFPASPNTFGTIQI